MASIEAILYVTLKHLVYNYILTIVSLCYTLLKCDMVIFAILPLGYYE